MLNKRSMIKLSLPILIGVVSSTGDKLVEISKDPLLRALCDNLTHATVAGLAWATIIVLSESSLFQNLTDIAICFLISSFIDLDHFIEAHSWKLNDATRLDKRPFLHSTTIPISLWLFLLFIGRLYENLLIENYSWIILTSFLTHHIRDGTRRGLWFASFGSTKPIPYNIYIILSMIFPYVIHYLAKSPTSASVQSPIYRGTKTIV